MSSLPGAAPAQEPAAPDSVQSPREPDTPSTQPSHTPVSTAAATYVGQAKCIECHEEVMEGWEHNPHHGAQVDGHVAGKNVMCESCHGPGSLHAEADGDESHPGFHAINVFKRMSPDAQAAVCRSCHTMGEQFHWDQSSHARNDVSCQSCHSVHTPKSAGGTSSHPQARPPRL